jgi:twinkle protein
MSWYEAGFYNVVSVPNGGAVNAEGLKYLDNCYQYFENKTKIILATDGDAVGFGLREELARRLGKDKCFKIAYPEAKVLPDKKKGGMRGCKDANEVLIHFGKEALKEVIEKATAWPIEDVLLVAEHMMEEIFNFWDNGFPSGIAVGIRGLDELVKFQPGQFTTITGIPGHGKSEFLDEIIGRSITTQSWKWGICSFENQPSSLHAIKVMQKIARRAFAFRKNPADRMSVPDFKSSILKVDEFCSFINISTADLTIDGILNKFTELVFRRGCTGFVIDPWNYIEESIPPGMTETKYISQCLSKIHMFCLKTGSHLFLVAHPTKMGKEANGKFTVPNMYSICGSSHFYNKTDNGITVYKDEVVTVYVQKVRYEWNGQPGYCQFTYNTQTRQYQPIDQISAAPETARLFIQPSNKQFDEE